MANWVLANKHIPGSRSDWRERPQRPVVVVPFGRVVSLLADPRIRVIKPEETEKFLGHRDGMEKLVQSLLANEDVIELECPYASERILVVSVRFDGVPPPTVFSAQVEFKRWPWGLRGAVIGGVAR